MTVIFQLNENKDTPICVQIYSLSFFFFFYYFLMIDFSNVQVICNCPSIHSSPQWTILSSHKKPNNKKILAAFPRVSYSSNWLFPRHWHGFIPEGLNSVLLVQSESSDWLLQFLVLLRLSSCRRWTGQEFLQEPPWQGELCSSQWLAKCSPD